MVLIAIQPAYAKGNPRKRADDTLEQEVPFVVPQRYGLLTREQRDALHALHPRGSARFWGATAFQDRKLDQLRTGDVVLFTGAGKIRGIGEVGYVFRNAEFAATLWEADKGKEPFTNVFSLQSFRSVDYPYSKLQEVCGYDKGDNFMGLRLIRGELVDAILAEFHITPSAEVAETAALEEAVAKALESGSKVVQPESVRTHATSYRKEAGEIFVNRAEALLVEEYRQHLTGVEVSRLKTPVGYTDLYVLGPDGHEILEAKSTGDHQMVRLAVGQLLDYAFHHSGPVSRLSALFPWRPTEMDVKYLNQLGIDCLYRVGHGEFRREDAPAERRTHLRGMWE
ncbi:hypothetical protein L6E12_06865 [Actinokineospora sp. PR83]|uniref:hypothetical protein n=1 Tax=Actinokineospora sp. PR83 TaxID=2884908 RepID=UPI001F1F9507|nr:hypothetical protein [Actinokineospora sp. PR83]MCG8915505.1 hypothetical protein [Actinokineospora sp. PR83]